MALWFATVDTMMMNEGVTLHADGCIKKKNMVSPESHAQTGEHGNTRNGMRSLTSQVRVRQQG